MLGKLIVVGVATAATAYTLVRVCKAHNTEWVTCNVTLSHDKGSINTPLPFNKNGTPNPDERLWTTFWKAVGKGSTATFKDLNGHTVTAHGPYTRERLLNRTIFTTSYTD